MFHICINKQTNKNKMQKFTTNYDRILEAKSKTFEDRLCEALENNLDTTDLMKEAKELLDNNQITKGEYKTLTNIELYKEILGL